MTRTWAGQFGVLVKKRKHRNKLQISAGDLQDELVRQMSVGRGTEGSNTVHRDGASSDHESHLSATSTSSS